MNEPNWDEAPEGATHWDLADPFRQPGWIKRENGIIYYWAEGWVKAGPGMYGPFVKMIPIPATAQDDQAYGRNAEQVDEAKRIDKQCRGDVAAALGFVRGGNFAWSYLLAQTKECVRVAETASLPAAVSGLGLSAHQSAPERVSVPRELLDKLSSHWTVGLDMGNEIKTLHAILAQPVADEQPEQSGLVEALRDLSWAVRRSPSCQDDIVSRCRCMRCALVRADAALSAQGGDT